jgi:hypothetical protein
VTGVPAPIDYTDIGYDAMRAAMLQLARESLPEWTDFSESDLGVLLVELTAWAADVTLYYQTRIAANLLPETSDEPDALVQLLRLIGYELRPPSPATADLRLGFPATEATPIAVPAGTQFSATAASGEQIVFESTRDVSIEGGELTPPDPGTGLRYFSPLAVVEGRTQSDDPLGVSDGSPNQTYPLRGKPVIAGSVDVRVSEPAGETRWREVETLAASSPADRHFVVRRSAEGAATIQLGDGVNGMVPPRGTPTSPVYVRATYRVGGGPQGNVAAETDFTPSLGTIHFARNPVAASGGAPAESVDRARMYAPRLFRSQERAVTTGDYADLALQVPGVGKSRAVALNWNEVLLYVAPSGQIADPSETLTRNLLSFFERRRLATAGLVVIGPDAVDLYLRATIRAQPYFLERDVRAAVEAAVAQELAFDVVDFGQRLFISRIYDVIQDLPQVAGLTVTQFSRSPAGGLDADGVIELGPSELPRPGYRDNPAVAPDPADPARRPPIRTTVVGALGESIA